MQSKEREQNGALAAQGMDWTIFLDMGHSMDLKIVPDCDCSVFTIQAITIHLIRRRYGGASQYQRFQKQAAALVK